MLATIRAALSSGLYVVLREVFHAELVLSLVVAADGAASQSFELVKNLGCALVSCCIGYGF